MPMPPKPDPLRKCHQCETIMKRKRFNGVLESMSAFMRRKYCDRACMARAFMSADPTLNALRWRARGLVKGECQVCGSTEMLGVHHLNEDPADNRKANIATLCNSCHQLWHWNFGKVRPKRRTDSP